MYITSHGHIEADGFGTYLVQTINLTASTKHFNNFLVFSFLLLKHYSFKLSLFSQNIYETNKNFVLPFTYVALLRN